MLMAGCKGISDASSFVSFFFLAMISSECGEFINVFGEMLIYIKTGFWNMDKEEIENAVEALMLLGKQEQDIIQSSDRRMQTWYPHRKLALELIADVKSNGGFQKTIAKIRSGVLPVFRQVDYAEKEEEALKKELEQISLADSILQREIAEAQKAYAQNRFGAEAKHKIAVFLQRTEQLQKAQFKERSLNEQVRSAVKNLGPTIRQELALIDEEEKKLDRLEKSADREARVRLSAEIGNPFN